MKAGPALVKVSISQLFLCKPVADAGREATFRLGDAEFERVWVQGRVTGACGGSPGDKRSFIVTVDDGTGLVEVDVAGAYKVCPDLPLPVDGGPVAVVGRIVDKGGRRRIRARKFAPCSEASLRAWPLLLRALRPEGGPTPGDSSVPRS